MLQSLELYPSLSFILLMCLMQQGQTAFAGQRVFPSRMVASEKAPVLGLDSRTLKNDCPSPVPCKAGFVHQAKATVLF